MRRRVAAAERRVRARGNTAEARPGRKRRGGYHGDGGSRGPHVSGHKRAAVTRGEAPRGDVRGGAPLRRRRGVAPPCRTLRTERERKRGKLKC